jgi:hypothetical protein
VRSLRAGQQPRPAAQDRGVPPRRACSIPTSSTRDARIHPRGLQDLGAIPVSILYDERATRSSDGKGPEPRRLRQGPPLAPAPAPRAPSRLRRPRPSGTARLFLEAQGRGSSALLARAGLGLLQGSESICAAIPRPSCGDARVARTQDGRWKLGEPAPSAAVPAEPALRERAWAVWAIEGEGRAAAVVRLEAGASPPSARSRPRRMITEDCEPPGAAPAPAARGGGWPRSPARCRPPGRGRPRARLRARRPRRTERRRPRTRTAGATVLHTSPRARPSRARLPAARSLERLAFALGVAFVEDDSARSRARLAAECL